VWRAFAIADSRRFFGFDLICAWQDVYLDGADVLSVWPFRHAEP